MCENQTAGVGVQYQVTREVRMYAELYHAANVLRFKAENDAKGSHYVIMSAILMVAFSFEAFLNHLGQSIFTDWSTHDRKSMNEKLNVLAEKVRFPVDRSRRPAQTIKILFQFRDRVAHARTEILPLKKRVQENYIPGFRDPPTKIERWCNIKNLDRAIDDVREIIFGLHNAAGLPGEPFTQGLSSYSLTVIDAT